MSRPRADHIGERFGKWTVILELKSMPNRSRVFLCECECGIQRSIPQSNLLYGSSTQCRRCSTKQMWADGKHLGKRRHKIARLNGKRMTVREACEKTGLLEATIRSRIRKGVRLDAPKHGGHQLVHDGVSMNMSGWARRFGVTRENIRQHIERGRTIGELIARYEG